MSEVAPLKGLRPSLHAHGDSANAEMPGISILSAISGKVPQRVRSASAAKKRYSKSGLLLLLLLLVMLMVLFLLHEYFPVSIRAASVVTASRTPAQQPATLDKGQIKADTQSVMVPAERAENAIVEKTEIGLSTGSTTIEKEKQPSIAVLDTQALPPKNPVDSVVVQSPPASKKETRLDAVKASPLRNAEAKKKTSVAHTAPPDRSRAVTPTAKVDSRKNNNKHPPVQEAATGNQKKPVNPRARPNDPDVLLLEAMLQRMQKAEGQKSP